MSAAILPITIEQGASFSMTFNLTDGLNGPPSNLQGVEAIFSISAGFGLPVLLVASSPSNGIVVDDSTDHQTVPSTITLTLTPEQTATLPTGGGWAVSPPPSKNLVYDIVLIYGPTTTERLVEGLCTVIAGVTLPHA